MMTLYTTAKPFRGDDRRRQMNALRSWRAVAPDARILLFADGAGYAEAADAVGAERVLDVACSEKGTPRFDAMYRHARDTSDGHVVYMNADIVLIESPEVLLDRLPWDQALLVTQRMDLDVTDEIDVSSANWASDLAADADARGALFMPAGIDIFAVRGDVWPDLPELVVGRAGYDNVLLQNCLSNGFPLVDATEAFTLIHQLHDYAHVGGGGDEVYGGAEAQANREHLAGGEGCRIDDANWALSASGELRRAWCRGDSARYAEVLRRTHGVDERGARAAELRAEFAIQLQKRDRILPRRLARYLVWAARRCAQGGPHVA